VDKRKLFFVRLLIFVSLSIEAKNRFFNHFRMANKYYRLIFLFKFCFEIPEFTVNDMIESEYFDIKMLFENIQTTKNGEKKFIGQLQEN